jgi:anti-sigma regulatory factor (Ser/Thr protein kinase)
MKAVAEFVSDRVELTKLEPFTADFASAAALSDKDLFALQIILEELVTNVIDYGQIPAGQPAAKVELSVEDEVLKILLTDYGREFNPLLRDDPDTTLPADQRQIGGLGIHFCKKLTEEQTYERRGNSNVLLLVRRLHP